MARFFQDHRLSLNSVTSLKYLGHIITSLDDAWTKLVGNLHNLRKIWLRLSIILRMDGGKPRVLGMLYKGGGADSTYFWVVYLGDDPPHGTVHWGVSTQGSYMDHWEVAPAVSVRKLVVPTFGDGNAGGRF